MTIPDTACKIGDAAWWQLQREAKRVRIHKDGARHQPAAKLQILDVQGCWIDRLVEIDGELDERHGDRRIVRWRRRDDRIVLASTSVTPVAGTPLTVKPAAATVAGS